MYQGFELKLSNSELTSVVSECGSYSGSLLEIGERSYRSFKRETMLKIASYSGDCNSAINGNEIEEKWFPKVQRHVFISHSHADEKLALILAGALKKQMGLDAFIDSAVWGFRDDLIKKLYGGVYGGAIYGVDTEKYLAVAAHVDCMLNKSLLEMMHNCEGLFFLNTPNSVSTSGVVRKTHSAWIYGELSASKMLHPHLDERRGLGAVCEGLKVKNAQFSRFIEYAVDTHHLKNLTPQIMVKWFAVCKTESSPFSALDELYRLTQRRIGG